MRLRKNSRSAEKVTVSLKRLSPPFPVSDTNVHFRSKRTFKMNARKAVLADNPELILRLLQLKFDETLSYPRISAQTGVSKTAIFSLVRRFHQVFTDGHLSGEYSCVQLTGLFSRGDNIQPRQ